MNKHSQWGGMLMSKIIRYNFHGTHITRRPTLTRSNFAKCHLYDLTFTKFTSVRLSFYIIFGTVFYTLLGIVSTPNFCNSAPYLILRQVNKRNSGLAVGRTWENHNRRQRDLIVVLVFYDGFSRRSRLVTQHLSKITIVMLKSTKFYRPV
jgi:hypothetical protein